MKVASKDKSKKIKYNNINKKDLWNTFDDEIENPDKTKIPLECIYGSCGNREFCERCETILAFSDEGFLTCTNNKCGIIYKDLVDQGAEWRYYGADDNQGSDPTRCGMPINPLLEESSYGCKIIKNGSMSYEMRKIGRYTEWQSMPYKEKSQYDDFQTIYTMANNAGILKKVIDDAVLYYKKISEYDATFRGDNREGVIAASVYIACRKNNYPRTAKEIANMFNLDVTSATKGCKIAMTIINDLEKDMESEEKTNFIKTRPDAFIERYCSKLNINEELIKLCKFITLKIEKNGIMPANTPPSIAAGVVYFVAQTCKLNISKKDVKGVSEISEVTINKCYKELDKMKDTFIPVAIIKKYNVVMDC